MILEFKVGYNISKHVTSTVTSNAGYYKCKFYMDKNIWEGTFLSAVFTAPNGFFQTIELGPYNDILMCVIPPSIVQHENFNLYIRSEYQKTNTITLSLSSSYFNTNSHYHPQNDMDATILVNNVLDDATIDALIENKMTEFKNEITAEAQKHIKKIYIDDSNSDLMYE